ncbi:MAG TPA: hypothetical protein PLX66_00390 [Bacilli bacterium]|nr:hypothetical protein [Bacilli bacterium]
MRQSIGGTWLFSLVIIFILLFTAYLAVAINYSKSFKVKNEVINIIEREEGLTSNIDAADPGAIEQIASYLESVGYVNHGKCPKNYQGYGEYKDGSTTKYSYCVRKYNTYNEIEKQRSYYSVVLFFDMDLPIFGDLFTFKVTGETTEIQYPADCLTWGEC